MTSCCRIGGQQPNLHKVSWADAYQFLTYRTTNRVGYREYTSDARQCRECPLREQCTKSRTHTKVVVRHVWEEFKERINQNRLTPEGKKIYARRKETVERSFADAKELHGHRYARFRGISKVTKQCLLAAACQNMKKIARLLAAFFRLYGLPKSIWKTFSAYFQGFVAVRLILQHSNRQMA